MFRIRDVGTFQEPRNSEKVGDLEEGGQIMEAAEKDVNSKARFL